MPGVVRSTELEDRVMTDILSRSEHGGVWLFAFGSLMWKRSFPTAEERPALIRGWHRAFCLGPDTRYRGNPEAPGYMLSLDRGGMCRGLALRLQPDGIEDTLRALLQAEPPFPPAWVRAETAQGSVQAFAFTCPRDIAFYAGLVPEDDLARRLARAVGMYGSMAEYLLNTLERLEALGIRDNYLRRLATRVAAEMEALPSA
jgi:cation transport protein ChaC